MVREEVNFAVQTLSEIDGNRERFIFISTINIKSILKTYFIELQTIRFE